MDALTRNIQFKGKFYMTCHIFKIILLLAIFTGCSSQEHWAYYANIKLPEAANTLIIDGEDLDIKDIHGDTPLLWAAKNGYPETVKVMLDREIDINEINEITGETALITAAKGNHTNVVKLLCLNGAKKEIIDNTGYSALDWAASNGNDEIVGILKDNSTSNIAGMQTSNPLVAAVYSNSITTVSKLINTGYSVNNRDSYGDTPLIVAAKTGNTEIASHLLQKGASLQGTDEFGRSPLMIASQAGHLNLAVYLMKKGANKNARSKRGYSPLMFAAANGQHAMVEYLLQNGVDLNQLDENQRSALYLASANGQWYIAKLLLIYGAKISTDRIRPEDKVPFVLAPMYEMTGEFYLEKKDKEKATKFFGLSEKSYKDLSDEYNSRATIEAIQNFFSDFGKILLITSVSAMERQHAKVQARQQAQISALSKSNTMGQYRQRLSTTLPIYEKHAQIAAEGRIQQYNQQFLFGNQNPNDSELSEEDYDALSEEAARKARNIKSLLQCISKTDNKDIVGCISPPSSN